VLWGPYLALVPLGVNERAQDTPQSPAWLAWLALAVAACALLLALGLLATRRARGAAFLGGALSALVLLIGAAGIARGHVAKSERRMQEERVHKATWGTGWVGRVVVRGVPLFAVQPDPDSPLVRNLQHSFGRPFGLLVLGVDNGAGAVPAELDLGEVELGYADGTVHPVLARYEVLASARENPEGALRAHGGRYSAPPGGKLGNALVFLPPGEDMHSVVALRVGLNGENVTISGRFLSATEKQTLAAPPPPGRP
jgi:hypothetical protein